MPLSVWAHPCSCKRQEHHTAKQLCHPTNYNNTAFTHIKLAFVFMENWWKRAGWNNIFSLLCHLHIVLICLVICCCYPAFCFFFFFCDSAIANTTRTQVYTVLFITLVERCQTSGRIHICFALCVQERSFWGALYLEIFLGWMLLFFSVWKAHT